MREDMFKVIVERPRRRPWTTPGRTRAALARALDDGAVPATGRRAASLAGARKELNENLGPLQRYLRRQVGRPWRIVFAEICARLDAGSTVKRHVRDHLADFVQIRVGIGRRGEWIGTAGLWRSARGVEDWTQPLYVDPVDGLVKETAKLRRRLGLDPRPAWRRKAAPAPDPDRVARGPDEEFRRLAGVWYRVRLGARVERDFAGAKLWCAGRDGVDAARVPDRRIGVWRELLDKRQLTTRELARAGLANAPR